MAKKQVPPERSRKQTNSTTPKKNNIKSKPSKTVDTNNKNKNKSRIKVSKTVTDDASSEENEVLVTPSVSREYKNDDVVVSSEADEHGVDETDEDAKAEKKKPKSNEHNKKSISIKRKTEKEDSKNKGKKRSKKEDDGGSDLEEKSENALYRFPMDQISRIIQSENPDVKISQEAVFLINKASEKFLEVFCKEAYACLFLEGKTYAAYNHLSSVVAKRKRFAFLSDFVPEKVKAADALAQISEVEK